MAIRTVSVNGTPPADPLVYEGDGPTLIGNTDITTSLWIGESNAITAGRLADAIQITPQSWVLMDGKESVFGITSGAVIQVNLIPGGLAFFQSGISGGGFVVNSNGAFFYDGAAGPGALIMSITGTSASGVDPYGNVYTPGTVCIGRASGIQILLQIISTLQAAMKFPTNTAIEATSPANITANIVGAGLTEFLQLAISGPELNIAGARDWVQLLFNSANAGNTSNANLDFIYVQSSGANHEYAVLDNSGFNILTGSAVAAHPGSNPAIAETWQSVAAGGSPAWTGTVFYRKTIDNEVEIVAQLNTPAGTPINNNTICTLPVGYRPSPSGIQFAIGSSTGTNATATLGTDGTIHTNAVATAGTCWFGPIRIPLDL